MTSIQFVRKGTSGIGNSPHGLIIPTEAAEIAGLQKGKYYLFEVRAREIQSIEELEDWQAKKYEVRDEKGRKVQKGDPAAVDIAWIKHNDVETTSGYVHPAEALGAPREYFTRASWAEILGYDPAQESLQDGLSTCQTSLDCY